MIDKKDIIKMAKHVFKRGKGYPDRRLIHPKREWTVGLFMSLLVLFVGGTAAAQLYSTYRNVNTLLQVTPATMPRYNAQAVETALTEYRLREQEYESLQKNKGVSQSVVPVVTPAATTSDQFEEDTGPVELEF